jgi:hypothetical protein
MVPLLPELVLQERLQGLKVHVQQVDAMDPVLTAGRVLQALQSMETVKLLILVFHIPLRPASPDQQVLQVDFKWWYWIHPKHLQETGPLAQPPKLFRCLGGHILPTSIKTVAHGHLTGKPQAQMLPIQ